MNEIIEHGIVYFIVGAIVMILISSYFQPTKIERIELCKSLGGNLNMDNPYNVIYGDAKGCDVYPDGRLLTIDMSNELQVAEYVKTLENKRVI